MKDMKIRAELPGEYKKVEKLIELSFQNEEFSDHSEHFLVARLRKSEAFVSQLSLVAEIDSKIVGYILFSKVKIGNYNKALALAPVAVLPEYQHQGIGAKLIKEGHRIAQEIGFEASVVLGHKDYYPRFGYKELSKYGIKLPFEGIPSEFCMGIELVPDALKNVKGVVEYAKEFEG